VFQPPSRNIAGPACQSSTGARPRSFCGAHSRRLPAIELAMQPVFCAHPHIAALVGIEVPLLQQVVDVAHWAFDESGDCLRTPQDAERLRMIGRGSDFLGHRTCLSIGMPDEPN
jgi:hypothetical protein